MVCRTLLCRRPAGCVECGGILVRNPDGWDCLRQWVGLVPGGSEECASVRPRITCYGHSVGSSGTYPCRVLLDSVITYSHLNLSYRKGIEAQIGTRSEHQRRTSSIAITRLKSKAGTIQGTTQSDHIAILNIYYADLISRLLSTITQYYTHAQQLSPISSQTSCLAFLLLCRIFLPYCFGVRRVQGFDVALGLPGKRCKGEE
jgi:hypothetical protein